MTRADPIAIGSRVPAFELRGVDREIVTNDHFAGASGVLAFFPKAFTDG